MMNKISKFFIENPYYWFSFGLRHGKILVAIVIKLTKVFLTLSSHRILQSAVPYFKPLGRGAMALKSAAEPNPVAFSGIPWVEMS